MNRRQTLLLRVLKLGVWFAAGMLPPHLGAATPAKPNIVFILADDSGLGEFGCYGGKAIPTPNVDRLAREGMRFTNAYSGNAVCAPTRNVVMTGEHPGHMLRRANQSKNGLLALPAGTMTTARMLHGAGYATGGFGKWGLGNEGTTGAAEKQGFDIFYGYYDQVHAHSYFPEDLTRNGVREKLPGNAGGRKVQYSHDLIEAETLRFIEAQARSTKPFFCYAAWTLPHGNFEIPSHAAFANRPWPEPVKIHAAMIARLDESVGKVMAKLRELGIDQNTLVIFSSDNGAAGPGMVTFNATAGLRGQKRHLYEGGIRAPFIARWPGRIAPGTTSGLLAGQVDIMATTAEVAGTKPPRNDGLSILPTLLGKPQSAKHEWLYWEIYEGPAPFQQAVRHGAWKGYRTALKGPLELYNLETDPAEKNNVAAQQPDEVKAIEALMAREHVPSPNYDPSVEPGARKSGAKKKKTAK
ncbi:MAG: arylsulfatase [Opitutaceae bacterium]|nr:arylsulfatase [Opitutaceae bacterium]